ncbi:DUF6671 family protein [Legionella worsleiensis]|uniref:DUF6671 domain-containing protein n=1 Tax=Legionella worsleiensis TaxID=45076 RepID=A0A0W1AKP8_9GAMM|nr:DUF6671 family protein [Legionella worsleiensis]KTD81897.1 hypothetical protein Lwor_0200 [Legionella worsleiensis]STY31203.1 Uncharacterised protein [Legionella worsleiensis]
MYYKNHCVLLASKHQKEQAIAPPFEKVLSCSLEVLEFDTDQFGTFTGEIPRVLSPYETCLLKAKSAAEQHGFSCSVASEGSFGPHPLLPFIASAQEIMVFVDREHDWVIAEQLVSQKTNYAMQTINQKTDIEPFLHQVQFPSHGLIVQLQSDKRVLAKGIKDRDLLFHHLTAGFQHDDELIVTTDMRAMMNPLRMEVIGELANKLALRIACVCTQCSSPGFGFKSTHGALPCACCGSASSFYAQEVWGCITCDHQEYKMRKDQLLEADPAYCNYCNP